LVWDWWRIG